MGNRGIIGIIVLILLIVPVIYSVDSVFSSKSDVVPDELNDTKVRVFVKYKESVDVNDVMRDRQLSLERSFGRMSVSSLESETKVLDKLNGYITEVDAAGLQALLENGDVDYVFEDYPVKASLDLSVPMINAPNVSSVLQNSSNITAGRYSVCVIDSGVYADHPYLQGKVIAQKCFCNMSGGCCPDGTIEDDNATDDNGHGTHVAGTIASQSSALPGVSPKVNIVAVKALDHNGDGYAFDIASAINYCIDNKDTYNISVISMSLGSATGYSIPCDDHYLAQWVNYAANNGITVVVSSGNEANTTAVGDPACASNAISVGAVDIGDNVVSFSNAAEGLSVLAPGYQINSSVPPESFCTGLPAEEICDDTQTKSISGTSMAAPHVSGVAALIIDAYYRFYSSVPSYSVVKSILQSTGTNVTDWRNVSIIIPRVDTLKAVLSVDTSTPLIQFTNCTPDNLAELNASNFTVCINTSKVVYNVTVEFDDQNYSAIGSYYDWNITLNLTSPEYLNYTIYANDYNGAEDTAARSIRHMSTKATRSNPSTASYFMQENQTLAFNFTYNDTDPANVSFVWYVNGTNMSDNMSYNFSTNYTSSGIYNITAKVLNGDAAYGNASVGWQITVNDTFSAPIMNSIHPSQNITIAEPQNQTFNITYNDIDSPSVSVYWYQDGINLLNSSDEFNFTGNYSSNGTYNVSVRLDDGLFNTSYSWNLTVNNTDRLPYFIDENFTSYFINTTYNITINQTLNITMLDEFFNITLVNLSSNLSGDYAHLIVNNTNKTLKITNNFIFDFRLDINALENTTHNLTAEILYPYPQQVNPLVVNESQKIYLNLSATDSDNQSITYSINSSLFSNISSDIFVWLTNTSSSGNYSFNLTAVAGSGQRSYIYNLTVLDLFDSDNDGIPDIQDDDDDNDGTPDESDNIIGNSSSIVANATNVTVLFDNSTTINNSINTSSNITIKLDDREIVSFTYNFSQSKLNLANISINRTNATNSSHIIVKGISLVNATKAVWMDIANDSLNTVCIKDEEVLDISIINQSCRGTNEYFITCNNSTQYNYTCYDYGTQFKIMGLRHSAVKQQAACVENWTCTAWSSGTCGTRTCTDQNYCGTEASKPSESSACVTSGGGGGSSGGGGGSSYTKVNPNLYTKTVYKITADKQYSFAINKPDFALTNISIILSENGGDVTLSARKINSTEARSRSIHYSKLKDVYSYFEINMSGLDKESISSIITEFAVEKSWLRDNANISMHVLEGGAWELISTEIVGSNRTHVVYGAQLPHLSYFAIIDVPVVEEGVVDIQNTTVVNGSAESIEPVNKSETADPPDEKDTGLSVLWIIPIAIGAFAVVFLLIFVRRRSIE